MPKEKNECSLFESKFSKKFNTFSVITASAFSLMDNAPLGQLVTDLEDKERDMNSLKREMKEMVEKPTIDISSCANEIKTAKDLEKLSQIIQNAYVDRIDEEFDELGNVELEDI